MDEIGKYARARIDVPQGHRGTKAQIFMLKFVESAYGSGVRERSDDFDFEPAEAIADSNFSTLSRFIEKLLRKWPWQRAVTRLATFGGSALALYLLLAPIEAIAGLDALLSGLIVVVVLLVEYIGFQSLSSLATKKRIELIQLEEDIYWSKWWCKMYSIAKDKQKSVLRETREMEQEYVDMESRHLRMLGMRRRWPAA